jgi:hypothetical protein
MNIFHAGLILGFAIILFSVGLSGLCPQYTKYFTVVSTIGGAVFGISLGWIIGNYWANL